MSAHLSSRFALLLAIAVVGIGLFALGAFVLFSQTGVHGAIARQITDAQELTSDIEPPPLYLIEAMVAIRELDRASDRAPALARYAALKRRYEVCEQAWELRLASHQTGEQLAFAKLTHTARDFFAIVDHDLMPVIQRGDQAGIAAILDGPLTRTFERHHEEVLQLMRVVADARQRAVERAHQLELVIGGLMVAVLVALLLVGRGLVLVRTAHQRELREREARFRYLSEASFEGIVMSEKGVLFDANPQFIALLGYRSLDELKEHMISELVAPENRSDFLTRIVDQNAQDYEVSLRRRDGVTLHVEVRPRYFALDGRRLRVATVRDVTQRKQAEAELLRHRDHLEDLVKERTQALEAARQAAEQLSREAQSANHAKSAFLASMSHEIRTPLNAVLGYAQLLTRDRSLAPEQLRAVEVINRSGSHLLALISDILDMSRIESGRNTAQPEDFDLLDLLDSLKSLFLLRARDRRLDLRLNLAADLPRFIRSDQRMLRQILVNLLSNAVKFTASGGVELRAGRVGGRLSISVHDSGSGIAPEDLARLFQPFVQVHAGRGQHEGSGLGLAISRGFAHALDGELSATSEVGHGTTFTLDIPLVVAESMARSVRSGREVIGLAPGSTPRRILVAEDHPDNQRLLHDLLAASGLEVRAVSDGAAAVEACRQWHPDLVWMDLDMPVMDGLNAAKAIRALPGPPPVIVALTAAAFVEDRKRILANGCDDLLHKPYQEEELFLLMENRLGVHFVWRGGEPAAIQTASDAELAAGIAGLTPEQHAILQHGVITGDLVAITTATRGWPDRSTAQMVERLVEEFALDRLERVLAQGRTVGP